MNAFIKELRKLTGVSIEYATAVWYTMNQPSNPKQAAMLYYRLFFKKDILPF